MRADQPRDPSKILFLDIETVPQQRAWEELDPVTAKLFSDKTRYEQERSAQDASQLYPQRAGILAEFGKIICIGVGYMVKADNGWGLRVTSFHGDDERALLLQFAELLQQHFATDEHWLCGHNAREFDLPYIARRCVVHRVRLPRLLDTAGCKPWEVGHLDTMALWSFGDRKNFTSLALLTHVLGIPTPKDDISGADVGRVYHEEHDVERIAAYCRRDVVATAQLYLRLTGRELVPEANISQV
jgi:3'-5' exonuclease